MDIQINPDPTKRPRKIKQKHADNFIKNTWLLLFTAWFVYLIPFPGTSYIASVITLGALVMTIVTLAGGKTQQGIVQLLATFIVSPIFYFIGMLIFWTFVTNSISPNNITTKEIRNVAVKDYNRKINKLTNKKHVDNETKPISSIKSQEKKDIVYLKYIIHLNNGGKIDCESMKRQGDYIIIKNKSGVLMDIDISQVEKIERFETINNKTNISSWKPTSKG